MERHPSGAYGSGSRPASISGHDPPGALRGESDGFGSLANRFVDTEIPHINYESSALTPDAGLIAKALIVIYEALHGGEEV